jgi:hypothetical protein
MICTTLNKIRKCEQCDDGWQKLLKYLGKKKPDNEPLALLTVLDSNGLDDAIWCLRAVPEHDALWRHYAIDCVERVADLLTDKRSLNALRVARRHALGRATDKELVDAAADAMEAALAKMKFQGIAWAAMSVASLARDISLVAWAAARCARAAREAAKGAAAGAAELTWQTARLRKLLTDGAWSPVEEA